MTPGGVGPWSSLTPEGRVWVVVSGARVRLTEYLAFAEKHGPDELILREGKLIPVGELIAHEIASLME